MFPTRSVPVPAPIRLSARDDYDVADRRRDLLLAAGAHVGLTGLERM
jgi:hypothetical protein